MHPNLHYVKLMDSLWNFPCLSPDEVNPLNLPLKIFFSIDMWAVFFNTLFISVSSIHYSMTDEWRNSEAQIMKKAFITWLIIVFTKEISAFYLMIRISPDILYEPVYPRAVSLGTAYGISSSKNLHHNSMWWLCHSPQNTLDFIFLTL